MCRYGVVWSMEQNSDIVFDFLSFPHTSPLHNTLRKHFVEYKAAESQITEPYSWAKFLLRIIDGWTVPGRKHRCTGCFWMCLLLYVCSQQWTQVSYLSDNRHLFYGDGLWWWCLCHTDVDCAVTWVCWRQDATVSGNGYLKWQVYVTAIKRHRFKHSQLSRRKRVSAKRWINVNAHMKSLSKLILLNTHWDCLQEHVLTEKSLMYTLHLKS